MRGEQKGSLRSVVLLCTAASALYLLLGSMCSPLYPLNIWDDANCLMTVGRVMKEGGVLYRDIYEQKGPLLYLIHMLAAMISDSRFFGVYLFVIVSLTAVLVLAQRLIRLWTDEHLACAGALLFGACVLVGRSFVRGDSAEEFCLPFLMAALYLVCAHGKRSESPLPCRTLFLLGLLAGCVAAIKYTALGLFIGLCAAQGVFLLVRRDVRGVLTNAGAFLAGMRQADLKPRARHIQIGEFFADACFQRTRRLLAAGRERLRQRNRRVILFRRLFFQVLQTVVRIFHPVQLRAAVVQIRQHVRHGTAIAF